MDKELGALLGKLLLDGLVFSAITAGLLAWLYRMNRKPRRMHKPNQLTLTRYNQKDGE